MHKVVSKRELYQQKGNTSHLRVDSKSFATYPTHSLHCQIHREELYNNAGGKNESTKVFTPISKANCFSFKI